MNFIQPKQSFDGQVFYISQFAPFTLNHWYNTVNSINCIQQNLNYHTPIKLNFILGSSQYSNFDNCDCRFELPFAVRYEIMVCNAVELSEKYNCIPKGLYHQSDYDNNIEWINSLLSKISNGSIIITNCSSCTYHNILKYTDNNYGHIIFDGDDQNQYFHSNNIRKLLVNGKASDAKAHLPVQTVQILTKHGLYF